MLVSRDSGMPPRHRGHSSAQPHTPTGRASLTHILAGVGGLLHAAIHAVNDVRDAHQPVLRSLNPKTPAATPGQGALTWMASCSRWTCSPAGVRGQAAASSMPYTLQPLEDTRPGRLEQDGLQLALHLQPDGRARQAAASSTPYTLKSLQDTRSGCLELDGLQLALHLQPGGRGRVGARSRAARERAQRRQHLVGRHVRKHGGRHAPQRPPLRARALHSRARRVRADYLQPRSALKMHERGRQVA